MIIGLVQTREYARAMMSARLSGQTLDDLVASRMERQALLATDRRFIFLHTEGALLWHVGSPAIMVSQLAHLITLSGQPNIRLGVISHDHPVMMPARHPFHLCDNRTVIVGTESGTAFITDPVEVATYDHRFAELETVAVFDDAACAVFQRTADTYRKLLR
jgi:hypothetical protein